MKENRKSLLFENYKVEQIHSSSMLQIMFEVFDNAETRPP